MSRMGAERATFDSGPSLVAFAPRERTRAYLRSRLPRRRGRVAFARSAGEMEALFRRNVVDLAIVDVGTGSVECVRAIALASAFPTIGFVGLAPYRVSDAPLIARCAELNFADVLAESLDDLLIAGALTAYGFSPRFGRLYRDPPPELGISGALRLATWRSIVSHAGRAVRTTDLAAAAGVSREHLSRSFASDGAPNLKRIIDFVRLMSAAELARNPGYDIGDVARVLGFASSSHLSESAHRLLGTQGSSLASLGAADLVERFASGRIRSRV